jgi:hypothetical protein
VLLFFIGVFMMETSSKYTYVFDVLICILFQYLIKKSVIIADCITLSTKQGE